MASINLNDSPAAIIKDVKNSLTGPEAYTVIKFEKIPFSNKYGLYMGNNPAVNYLKNNKAVYSKSKQAETVAWVTGYNIMDYYHILAEELIPDVKKLFNDVYSGITEIKKTSTLELEIGGAYFGIVAFDPYKEIIDFFNRNFQYTAGVNANSLKLTTDCLNTFSYNNDALISRYNFAQKSWNGKYRGKLKDFVLKQPDKEKWYIEVREIKWKKIDEKFKKTL